MSKIRVGIVGYGNLGRGVELALSQNPDMELVAVFTRRDPMELVTAYPNTATYSISDAENFVDKIDVMILCGGSATDLIVQSPGFSKLFNVIDSFDTHARIPEHFANVDAAAIEGGKIAIISVGWDPGLFSLARLYFGSALPNGKDYTFWGKGVSQGHSDAIRRVVGVENGIQYTVPSVDAITKVRDFKYPAYSSTDQHKRECYVVAKPGASTKDIAEEISSMPNYFADYETEVHFISNAEFEENHNSMPHGGTVFRAGKTGSGGNNHLMEFSLKLDSNPEFTSSVLVAYARAAYRLSNDNMVGAKTVLDIPPSYLSPKSNEDLRKELL